MRAKSIKKYIEARKETINKEPDQNFLWKATSGQIINFCEWALIPIINGDVDVDNVEEYAKSLGKIFGIDVKDNFTTTKVRIEQKSKIQDYYSNQFFTNLQVVLAKREEERVKREKTRAEAEEKRNKSNKK